jgi:hypothetical protein
VPPLTPGAYLKMRRCAAGLSVADVAAKIATAPRLAEHARAELIELIEADAAPASFETIVVLSNVYWFDFDVLAATVRIALGADIRLPSICRICGCSACDPCIFDVAQAGSPICELVALDLCSRCAPAGATA